MTRKLFLLFYEENEIVHGDLRLLHTLFVFLLTAHRELKLEPKHVHSRSIISLMFLRVM